MSGSLDGLMRGIACLLLGVAAVAQADTYGRQERVKLMSTPNIEVVAKLDPNAASTFLSAFDVKYFLRDGDTWARFVVDNGSVLPGSRVTVERPVLRDLRVKQRNGGLEHRPVVALEYCVGERLLKAEVTVSDRVNYNPPMLIGQADLARLGAVDASREFTHDAICKPDAAAAPGQ